MDWKNKLYFGDNLEILRAHVADESVDLIVQVKSGHVGSNYVRDLKHN